MSRSKFVGSLTFALFTAACIQDSTGPDSFRYGRYRLSTINGAPLPGLMVENSVARLEFLEGTLRLNRDMSFTDSTDLRVTSLPSGTVRRLIDVAAGTFRFAGDTVFLDSTRDEHYHMVFQAAGSLTQELSGSRLVYRK